MDELVGLVSAKTGLSEETAREVVDIVIGYLKDKLPAPIAGQIDGLLAGTGSTPAPRPVRLRTVGGWDNTKSSGPAGQAGPLHEWRIKAGGTQNFLPATQPLWRPC